MPSLWKLQAVFEYAETAVDTAIQILRLFRLEGQPFHMGIHTGRILVDEVELSEAKKRAKPAKEQGPVIFTLPRKPMQCSRITCCCIFSRFPPVCRTAWLCTSCWWNHRSKSAVDETYLKDCPGLCGMV